MIRRFRPAFWPTVISVPALIVLLALGTWQMNRLAWKEGLIRDFAERVNAEPLTSAPPGNAHETQEYRRVRFSGRYLNEQEMFLAGRTFNGRGGWAILTPFRTDDGSLVIVDRGWVPLDRKDPRTRAQSLIEGPTTVEGLIRRPNLRTYFTPENEPDKNLWFSADVQAMAKKAGLPEVRPYLIEGLRQVIPGGFPVGGEIQVALRNDHLQYAITWYSLAIALVVIYVLFHLKLERERAPMSAYLELEGRFKRMGVVGDAGAVLGWDRAAMMPEGGNAGRSEVVATLQVMRHEMLTDAKVGDLMDEAGGDNTLDDWQRANLREMKRVRLHATAVPADLVAALSKAALESEMVWRKARPASDLAMLMPHLKKVLDLTKEKARIKSAALGVPLYEALMDEYEPGGRTDRIDAIFDDYAAFLPGFLEQVLARQASRPPAIRPEGPFAIEKQKALGQKLMGIIGFDFNHGRLDVSAHPFCGGVPDDVRITTRYTDGDFTQSLMGVLHETGHAMYERQLPSRWRWQPVGEARGMSVHESQSLLIEMQVCRGPEFMAFAAPLMREAFGGSGPAWEPENLRKIYSGVARSFIRVEADEVTYPAHVILRYRLEKRLIAGDLRIEDVPGAWAEELKRLLGITPPDDRRGCLQDIHWPEGIFGYFPTYSLGAMTAAQLFDAAKRADPSILPGIAKGDFAPLMGWLKANVHGLGSKLSTDELLAKATGRPLDPEVFKAHLKARYLA